MTTQQNNQVPGSDNASNLPKSVGKILGESREQQGLSVLDVSNRIKFAPRQIEALEADDFAMLPEAAFVRGFVRSYARLLQLNPDPLLAALPFSHTQAASSHEIKSVDIPMPSVMSARRHNIVWLAGALVVALSLAIFVRMRDHAPAAEPDSKTVVQAIELPSASMESASAPVVEQVTQVEAVTKHAVASPSLPSENTLPKAAIKKELPKDSAQVPATVLEREKKVIPKNDQTKPVRPPIRAAQQAVTREPSMPAVTADTVTPSGAAATVNTSSNFSEHALRLEFDEDAWVEIKDGNDKVLISRMHRAGSLLRVAGKSPLDITIGNAKAVRLFDKGKRIPLGRHTTAEVAKFKLK